LFNNGVIFVLLFGKAAKLLLSSMVWDKETKDSLTLVTRLWIKTNCSVKRLRNEFRNKHWYLASISRLLKHMDNSGNL